MTDFSVNDKVYFKYVTVVFFSLEVYTETMPAKFVNEYDIDKIKELKNSINPETKINYSFREIASILGYTNASVMMSWLKKNYNLECSRPAYYPFKKIKKKSGGKNEKNSN